MALTRPQEVCLGLVSAAKKVVFVDFADCAGWVDGLRLVESSSGERCVNQTFVFLSECST